MLLLLCVASFFLGHFKCLCLQAGIEVPGEARPAEGDPERSQEVLLARLLCLPVLQLQ